MNKSQKVLREISDDPEKSIRIIKNIAMLQSEINHWRLYAVIALIVGFLAGKVL